MTYSKFAQESLLFIGNPLLLQFGCSQIHASDVTATFGVK